MNPDSYNRDYIIFKMFIIASTVAYVVVLIYSNISKLR